MVDISSRQDPVRSMARILSGRNGFLRQSAEEFQAEPVLLTYAKAERGGSLERSP